MSEELDLDRPSRPRDEVDVSFGLLFEFAEYIQSRGMSAVVIVGSYDPLSATEAVEVGSVGSSFACNGLVASAQGAITMHSAMRQIGMCPDSISINIVGKEVIDDYELSEHEIAALNDDDGETPV